MVLARDFEFEVDWHPFELNPFTPLEGVPRETYLARKFGGLDRLRAMDARLKEVGEKEGIEFHQEKIAFTPNTRKAHRLIWWAGPQGFQNALVDKLFRAYFTEGRNIGADDVLLELAEESGLPPSRVQSFLMGNEGQAEVQAMEDIAKKWGVQAVPFFVLNEKFTVEGAEPPETFLQIFESLRSARLE